MLVAGIVVASASLDSASASLWKRAKTDKTAEPAAVAAAGQTLSAVEIEGSRVLLHTSGSPAYTSYSPSPDVFVVDLTATSKASGVVIPATLPAGVTSIAAEEAVEMGNRLTRVTVRLREAASPTASVNGTDVVIAIPEKAPVDTVPPLVAAVADPQPPPETPHAETPHVEALPEPNRIPAEPVATAEPLPLPAAKSIRRIESSGADIRINGDGAMKYKAFRLENPSRVVLDIDGINKLPKNAITINDSPVKKVRVSQFKSGPEPVTRVVLDLGSKADYRLVDEGDHVTVVFGDAPATFAAAPVVERQAPVQKTIAPPPPPAPATAAASTMTVTERPAHKTDIPASVPTVAENAATWRMPETASKGARSKINAPADQAPPATSRRQRTTTSTPVPAPSNANPENVFTEPQDLSGPQIQNATTPQGTRTLSEGPRVFTGEPISLNLKDADLKDVLRTFAQLTGLNIAVDPGVTGQVTVDFVDVPWDQALDIILRQNNLAFVVEGNVMRVGTIERLANETAATRRLQEEEQLNVPRRTISFKLSYARAQEVQALLAAIASPRARIIVDARTNQLIVSEIPQYLVTMRNLIDTVDVPTKQVVIEARIVETTKNFAQQYGFQWGFNGAFDPALGTGTGLVFPNRVGFTGGPFSFTGGAPPVLGLSLTDVLGSFNLDLALHAFELEGLVKVVSAPRVTTQDNQAAEIQSGFQIPYQTRINFTTTITYVDATLRLSVTPQITEAGTVIMDIAVQKTEPATGLAIEGGAGTPLSTRQARTRLMVRDGGTSVIGGIYQTKDNNSQSRLPFVHQIPIIGALFRTHNISSTHDELLIFITPRIVRGS
ncbi:MAG TPA: type IV pilus secretin PilQ [Thermoanaerobaculia bacterium]|nr:type IV pilus secretin PilQ [Thermoanaerobaculia bacterium]